MLINRSTKYFSLTLKKKPNKQKSLTNANLKWIFFLKKLIQWLRKGWLIAVNADAGRGCQVPWS